MKHWAQHEQDDPEGGWQTAQMESERADALAAENEALRARIRELESRLAAFILNEEVAACECADAAALLASERAGRHRLRDAIGSALVVMFTNADCLNAAHSILSRVMADEPANTQKAKR